VERIEYLGLSPELQQRVQGSLTVREGDTLKLAEWDGIRESLRKIDEHLFLVIQSTRGAATNVILRIALREDTRAGVVGGTVRVGGGAVPVAIVRVEPQYSEESRKAKWQGAVLLQVVIDESGVPQDIKVIRPLGLGLDEKAIEAVRQWRFKPALLNGKPVSVSANLEVNFHL
jgi:TonB family protein